MTLAAPVEPAIDSSVLGAWLQQARAGDVFEYHRGLLTVDRTAFGQLSSEAARVALDRLADLALRLAAEGRVHLMQRRLAPGAFAYLAVARSPATPQHPEAPR
jgi:nucleotide-binding universal stress UspA family protein